MSRSFNEIIAEIDGGRLLEELSEASAEITSAVQETSKVGELTLTIKFKQNKGNQLFLQSSLKKKVPNEGIAEALFFADQDGNLTRRDPQQTEMFSKLRSVE